MPPRPIQVPGDHTSRTTSVLLLQVGSVVEVERVEWDANSQVTLVLRLGQRAPSESFVLVRVRLLDTVVFEPTNYSS